MGRAYGASLTIRIVLEVYLATPLPHASLRAVRARLHHLRGYVGLVRPRGTLHALPAEWKARELALWTRRAAVRALVRATTKLVVGLWLS